LNREVLQGVAESRWTAIRTWLNTQVLATDAPMLTNDARLLDAFCGSLSSEEERAGAREVVLGWMIERERSTTSLRTPPPRADLMNAPDEQTFLDNAAADLGVPQLTPQQVQHLGALYRFTHPVELTQDNAAASPSSDPGNAGPSGT
jgi:hypothetical protein